MGESNKRGTFAQRREAALSRGGSRVINCAIASRPIRPCDQCGAPASHVVALAFEDGMLCEDIVFACEACRNPLCDELAKELGAP